MVMALLKFVLLNLRVLEMLEGTVYTGSRWFIWRRPVFCSFQAVSGQVPMLMMRLALVLSASPRL